MKSLTNYRSTHLKSIMISQLPNHQSIPTSMNKQSVHPKRDNLLSQRSSQQKDQQIKRTRRNSNGSRIKLQNSNHQKDEQHQYYPQSSLWTSNNSPHDLQISPMFGQRPANFKLNSELFFHGQSGKWDKSINYL